MSTNKEFHYKESDIKGTPNLIDDCKNHYVHKLTFSKDCDLDVILNGINNNESDLDILKQLPNVSCDNIYMIMSGIRAIRKNVPVNDELAFEKHFTSLLSSFGFDFEKMLMQAKKSANYRLFAESYSFLVECVEMFVKYCEKNNYDVIDILLS